MDLLNSRLSADKKYLCGDELTIYDFFTAGFIVNFMTNANARNADILKPVWDAAPERVKKYHDDFMEEMKEYMDARDKDCTF